MNLTNKEIITVFLQREGQTKQWLADKLLMSRKNLYRRLDSDNWTKEEIQALWDMECRIRVQIFDAP